jgi:BirA family biotin operon repressor/biotin-[acetyl-CoA-carboxylase] ligase
LYKIPAKTLFLGKNLVFVSECHSTNDLATKLCQQPDTPDGTLVITNKQIAGRGQRGNTWEAEPGLNLTFSIILKPVFLAPKDQFYLNIIISLAVHDFVKKHQRGRVAIKWPNDILLSEKKICGILIENQLHGNRFKYSIAGVGFNVNQQKFNAPEAVSLSLASNIRYNLQAVLDDLLHGFEKRYLELRKGNLNALREEYLSKLYWLQEEHTFLSGNASFTGAIQGIDDSGRLMIKSPNGIRSFDIKEVQYSK